MKGRGVQHCLGHRFTSKVKSGGRTSGVQALLHLSLVPLHTAAVRLHAAVPCHARAHPCLPGGLVRRLLLRRQRHDPLGDAADGAVAVVLQPLVAVGVADMRQARGVALEDVAKLMRHLAMGN